MTDRDKFELMCEYYLSLVEGDTFMINVAFDLMKEEGIIDEDGNRIYDDE